MKYETYLGSEDFYNAMFVHGANVCWSGVWVEYHNVAGGFGVLLFVLVSLNWECACTGSSVPVRTIRTEPACN